MWFPRSDWKKGNTGVILIHRHFFTFHYHDTPPPARTLMQSQLSATWLLWHPRRCWLS